MIEIVENDAPSVESAIDSVAQARHLSPEAVKLHWRKHQDDVWLVYGAEIERHMGFSNLRDAVKSMTASARGKK
ncbi:hypothetical protein [Luteimonas pelagia]